MPGGFASRIAATLAAAQVERSDSLLLGFSGGRDSVALAEALSLEGFRNLCLVHLDHGLRTESEGDAEWVKRYARARGLEVEAERIDVRAAAQSGALGVEEAARNARYALFTRVAAKRGSVGVLLAHHADDQAETFLFRLLRGAGASGLGAMAVSSVRQMEAATLRVLRPMLGIWRNEVDRFVGERGLEFLEDPSNQSGEFTRNRLRHELIPHLEQAMRRPVRDALWRTAEVLRAEGEYVAAAEAALGAIREELTVSTLREAPLALRRRRVARWLADRGVRDIGFELVEAVCGLATRTAPAKVNLPGGLFARRRAGRIFIEGGSV